jgi:hypothetical protein
MPRAAHSGSLGNGWGDEPRTRRALAHAECQDNAAFGIAYPDNNPDNNAERHSETTTDVMTEFFRI